MHPVEALERLGGVGDLASLLRLTTKRQVKQALASGQILRPARGRYVLPTASDALTAAARLTATVSHASAAAVHGWELAVQPERPTLVVPRNRALAPYRRRGLDIRFRDLAPEDTHGPVTSHYRTVLDCARDLPFAEALAVADSALRSGDVDQEELERRALSGQSHGRKRVLDVVTAASPLAANPFESTLRAIASTVPGLHVVPQVEISHDGEKVRPDLVDTRLRLVLEADSHEFHTNRRNFHRDCRRYNWLVRHGWTVLRFAYEDVMFDSAYVREVLVSLVPAVQPR